MKLVATKKVIREITGDEMNKKDEAVDVMQEYFPRGGWDYDDICKLYDAIEEGKIPHLKTE
ncbi:hypothetical protein [Xenorhabdus innexi]|uniref:Uncharacterized protein n=1 Tax=Xenorhabdus innexi TaxID=290109 RepID=A0A1N6MX03_9GAMM|nr:hypothetical protein [Xenorhabdus innexi]PHM33313.1 hypothetical protein Xinn_02570 [Xenorhabdus innexi]SIP73304.1 hypothetical protein XIS1_1800027 [Xenorhabdus innexi]